MNKYEFKIINNKRKAPRSGEPAEEGFFVIMDTSGVLPQQAVPLYFRKKVDAACYLKFFLKNLKNIRNK